MTTQTTATTPALAAILDQLSRLAPQAGRAALDELSSRLAERRFRVLVVGEAKRGKSTLVNALLGRALLPAGVTPVTALPTQIRYGSPHRLEVAYQDGRTTEAPFDELATLVTEEGNPHNRRGVAAVTAYLEEPLLAGGVELVDTPGVGSVFAHNTAAATAVLDTMDAAVLVLTADPPLSASERDLLTAVRARSVALFVVLNKVDRLTPPELAEAEAFTAKQVAETVGTAVPVYPVSGRLGLAARQRGEVGDFVTSGLAQLRANLTSYLANHRETDLSRSVAAHARRLALSWLDEAVLTVRAADLAEGEATDRVARFRRRLDGLDERRHDANDVIAASAARLLADLNDAARWETPGMVAEVRRAVEAHLAGPLAAAGPVQVERDGREYAIALTTRLVDRWRAERHRALHDGLSMLDARLAEGIARELAGVRAAARDLLGIELAIPAPTDSLLPESGADYDFAGDVGATVELASAVRHRLPGGLGRRAARAWLRDQLDTLVSKQVGRTRSALQQAVAAARVELVRATERRYTDAVAGLVRAMDAAADLARTAGAEVTGQRAALGDRATQLRLLCAQLASVDGPPASGHGDQTRVS